MAQTQHIGFFQQLGNGYHARREYVAARKKIQSLVAQRQAAENEFQTACQELGTKAAELNLATTLPAGQAAAEQRHRVAEAQETLSQREATLKSAEDAHAADTAKYGQIIPSLQAEHRSLADAARSARAELDEIWGRVGALQSQTHADENAIADAAEGKPVSEPLDAIRQRIAESIESLQSAQTQLPEAHEKYVQAASLAQTKAAELQQTQQTWSQLDARHNTEVQAARTARDEASRSVETATGKLASTDREFGREIFSSSQRPAELEPSISAAQAIAARMADVDAQRANLQSVMTSTRPEARRFTTIVVVATLVLIGIIAAAVVLATGVGRNKAEKSAAPGGASPTSSPAAESPAQSAPLVLPAAHPGEAQPNPLPPAVPTTAPAAAQ